MLNQSLIDNPLSNLLLRVVSLRANKVSAAIQTNKNAKNIKSMKSDFGFCIMRAQPFHNGHSRLIKTMIDNCHDCVVIIGSVQESNTPRNPLDFETRKILINNVFPNIKVLGLKDLGNPPKWADYVLDFLSPLKPDAYFAGSEEDVNWFNGKVKNLININRQCPLHTIISGSDLRDLLANKNPEWKKYINPKNHQIIEENFYGKSLELPR